MRQGALLLLLVANVVFAAEPTARCTLEPKSILSWSRSGVPQVSSLGEIEATCSGPERPFLSKPGDFLNGLRIKTTAYEIAADGIKKLIPSDANSTGEGRGKSGDLRDGEWVDFTVHPALDLAERDEEIKQYLDNFEAAAKANLRMSEKDRKSLEERLRHLREHPGEVAPIMQAQNRIGHFLVECSIVDGEKVIAIGKLEMEVVDKGRISDTFAHKK